MVRKAQRSERFEKIVRKGCVWGGREDDLDFAQSEGFQEYSKIKEYTDSSEVKHIVRWKVE